MKSRKNETNEPTTTARRYFKNLRIVLFLKIKLVNFVDQFTKVVNIIDNFIQCEVVVLTFLRCVQIYIKQFCFWVVMNPIP